MSKLISKSRYIVYCIMQVIVSAILALTQRGTWEISSNTYDLIHGLSTALMIAIIAEIVIFIIDYRVFAQYSAKWKAAYFLPALIALMLDMVLILGKENWLFQLHEKVFISTLLSTAHIWGSILGVAWSIFLSMKRCALK